MYGIGENIRQMSLPQKIVWALFLIIIVYGLYLAVARAWVGDDAFISFRYAQNLVEGKGLVYNAGERVEGYTNFLWTMIIALGMWLGMEPIGLSQVLGIISYVFTVLLLLYLSIKISGRDASTPVLIIPLAAAAILLQYDLQMYATSGLETMFLTALVTAGFTLLVPARSRRLIMAAGLMLVLAIMTRPDAIILYLMAILFMALSGKETLKRLPYYLVPAVAIYVPYWLWRYSYYGYPFPNTYYAKSAFLPYYSQGLTYLGVYFKTYYILFLIPIVMVVAMCFLYRNFALEKKISNLGNRAALLAILFIVPYTFYIVRVGGDFMSARFFIPITPLMFLLFESTLLKIFRRSRPRLIIAFIILASLVLRWNQFETPLATVRGIADEPAHYPEFAIEAAQADGGRIKRNIDGTEAKFGFYGGKAMLMYYSEVPVAIESDAGLTDEYIAHLPITERGRPGHEKDAPREYLADRRINFLFINRFSSRGPSDDIRWIYFDKVPAYIIAYDNKIMEHLKQFPEIRFVDFPKFLDDYIKRVDSAPELREPFDVDFFKLYYFDFNDDPERLRRWVEFHSRHDN